jgi:hypothetical protein
MTPQAHLVFGLLVIGGLLSIVVSLLIAAFIGGNKRTTNTGPGSRPRLVRYQHHGASMVVRADLRGRHREHCLCYGCGKFDPTGKNNCPIAQAVFDNCVKHTIVSPVWECKEFQRNDAGLHV